MAVAQPWLVHSALEQMTGQRSPCCLTASSQKGCWPSGSCCCRTWQGQGLQRTQQSCHWKLVMAVALPVAALLGSLQALPPAKSIAKNPAELPLEAGDGCGSALAGVCCPGADDWSKKPLLPDSFQSEGLLAFLKLLLLLDLAGAGLAKNPAELPLEAGHGFGSALAGALGTGADDWSKKPLLPDSFQSEGLLAFLKLLLLLDLAGAGLAPNPAELPLEAGVGCGSALAGALGTGADDWSKNRAPPGNFQSAGLLVLLKLQSLSQLWCSERAKKPTCLPWASAAGPAVAAVDADKSAVCGVESRSRFCRTDPTVRPADSLDCLMHMFPI